MDEVTKDEGRGSKALVAVVCALGVAVTGRAEDRAAPVTRPVPSHAAPAPVRTVAPVSFRNQVIPVLTKAGCNSGACHGAAAGKNGFGLTLRGYDPMADYDTITRQAGGRRVNKMEPAKSLMLLKPTETVPHVGGRRFTVDSPSTACSRRGSRRACRRLATATRGSRVSRLRRATRRSPPAPPCQLSVTAFFTDGSTADVTHWAKYGTADETVAHVDDDGRVTVKGPGETAIAVSFLTGVALARVRSPFPVTIPDATFTSAERFNAIDEPVLAKLQELHIPPSPLCSDHEFIRRAFLDAAGTLPTRADVDAFVADTESDKRARLVDSLFERDEFVDYWAYKWSDLLLVSSRSLGRNNVKDFYTWIRAAVKSNMPWDRFVYALTTATGRTDENGAANYYLHPPQPDRPCGELHAGLPRPDAHLRALPQPPDGEVDAGGLLRVCEPVRPRLGEGRRLDVGQERHVDRLLDAGR